MSRYFFIQSSIIKRIIFLVIALWFFNFFLLAFVALLLSAVWLFLFRRKQVDMRTKRLIGTNIIVAPVTGKYLGCVDSESRKTLSFRILPWHNYGLYLPVGGEIIDSIDYSGEQTGEDRRFFTLLRSKMGFDLKVYYYSFLNLAKTRVFVREGDRGVVGGLIGYLPFGGKVVIELPSDCEVLLKKGDNVLSSQTLLASFKDK